MRICMDRINPTRRDNLIHMSLSQIKTPGDLDKAAEKVTRAVGRGKITPIEGGRVMSILADRSKIIETVQLDSRIANLEERIDPADLPLAA